MITIYELRVLYCYATNIIALTLCLKTTTWLYLNSSGYGYKFNTTIYGFWIVGM